MGKKIIETFDLTKRYRLKKRSKSILALNKINLEVYEGEILGILGPNGAGKTTLLELLCTIKKPTSGYALVNGYNILKQQKKVKDSIGLMLGSWMVYFYVTGRDNLTFFSKIYGIKNYKNKINELAKDFNFYSWLDEYTEYYSTGMRIKLCLMRTLLIDRKILYMDEPTSGLDPKVTRTIIQKILSLKKMNKTILFTTHRMHVANTICDRIALIKNGELFKIDTVKNLKKILIDRLNLEIDIKENKNQLMKDLKSNNFIEKIIPNATGFIIQIRDNSYYQEIFEIVRNYKILKFKEIEPTLDDVFTTLL